MKKQQEEDAIRQQKEMKKQKKVEMKLLKRTIRESFPPELAAGDTDALPLAFKMPSGDRINRIFNCHDSLFLLRNFVFCQPKCPPKFDIMKSFPRKCLPHPDTSSSEDMDKSLKDFGLSKNEMLFVQQTFDSEDEESETGESIAESTTSLPAEESKATTNDADVVENPEIESLEGELDFVASDDSSSDDDDDDDEDDDDDMEENDEIDAMP